VIRKTFSLYHEMAEMEPFKFVRKIALTVFRENMIWR